MEDDHDNGPTVQLLFRNTCGPWEVYVDPEPDQPTSKSSGWSTGATIGLVAGLVVLALIVGLVVAYKSNRRDFKPVNLREQTIQRLASEFLADPGTPITAAQKADIAFLDDPRSFSLT